MLSRFYFSDLFLYGKEITPYFMPRFILSGRKDSPAINYPFIYSCNITEQGIELHSLPHPQIGCDISYQDMKWVEMFVIRRVWGMAWTTIIAPNFNLDFIVHTWDHDLEIEIPACYEGKRVCDILKEHGIPVYDRFGVFEKFDDHESFHNGFAQYFSAHYHELAEQYDLEDPRVGFKKPDTLKGMKRKKL